MYQVKEVFLTLQGEGFHSGRAAVFLRFTGCNLWSGREQDRQQATCQFCDTDFVGTNGTLGGKFASASDLASVVSRCWHSEAAYSEGIPFVVCTGGEPLLQLDAELIAALHAAGFEVAIETNGTLAVPEAVDWICCSPKAGSELIVTSGHELKLVYPQPALEPDALAELPFDHFYLQPMDGPKLSQNTALAIAYCRQHPRWKLSLQMHKLAGIR
jgi:7-carboxy-7-deazaguanine synthase (Cx14CxxC type)